MSSAIVISPGPFSAHHVVAAGLVTLIPEHKDVKAVQTRNEVIRKQVVAEIGLPGEYDVDKLRFCFPEAQALPVQYFHGEDESVKVNAESKISDAETLSKKRRKIAGEQGAINGAIPLAIVGSIWFHYGKKILSQTFGLSNEAQNERIWNLMYEQHFKALDASFHGIPMCACTVRKFHSVVTFSNLVSTMDPRWEGGSNDTKREEKLNECVGFVRELISDQIKTLAAENLLALEIVSEAFSGRSEFHPSKRIIFLKRFVPWRDLLYELEAKEGLNEDELIRWVCFQDDRTLEWRATSPASLVNRFANRSLVDESLRGLRNEELVEKIQIDTPAFVHHSGFTCGAKTKESVIKLIEFISK